MIEILMKLAQISGKYPDFRFMQLIENILGNNCAQRFYMTDKEFLNRLKAYEKSLDEWQTQIKKDDNVKLDEVVKQAPNPLYPNWVNPDNFKFGAWIRTVTDNAEGK